LSNGGDRDFFLLAQSLLLYEDEILEVTEIHIKGFKLFSSSAFISDVLYDVRPV
jgi:hypothetical protein